MEEIVLEYGKYRFWNDEGILKCDRYGKEWRDFTGVKALLVLFQECLRQINKKEELFVIIKEGVYRHEIIGIYEVLEKAIEEAEKAQVIENSYYDGYHNFSISKAILNEFMEDVEFLFKISEKETWISRLKGI